MQDLNITKMIGNFQRHIHIGDAAVISQQREGQRVLFPPTVVDRKAVQHPSDCQSWSRVAACDDLKRGVSMLGDIASIEAADSKRAFYLP
eukprot:scaffold112_cov57-Attheya_sp.AAC.1